MSNQSIYAATYQVTLFYSTTANGTYNHAYSSASLTALPTDLKNLPGSGGTFIQNNPGYYRLIIYGRGVCGNIDLKSFYFRIIGAPIPNASFITNVTTRPSGAPFVVNLVPSGTCTVPYNTQLRYVNGAAANCNTSFNGYIFPMESASIANANQVGKTFTVFDLSNVGAGTGSETYSVTIKTDIWNGSSWSNMNYLGIPEVYNNISTAPLLGLLQEGGSDPSYNYYNYFATVANGEIFRITLTVDNECGSTSQSQIIRMNTASLRKTPLSGSLEEDQVYQEPRIFPNPTSSNVSFEIETTYKDIVNITIYDLKGSLVMHVVTNVEAIDSKMVFQGNLEKLTKGMYLYEIKINNNVYKGKLSKE